MIGLMLAAAALQPGEEIDCSNPMAQVTMNICERRAFEQVDADLNRVWPQVLRRAQQLDRDAGNGEAERRLRAAQRAWIAFRDANCQMEGLEGLGGSMEPMLVSGCMRSMTERRIGELQMLLVAR